MARRYYFEKEETVTKRVKGYVEIEDSYTQIYDNLSKVLPKLTSIVDVQFLFYACTISGTKGSFISDERLHNNFNEHLRTNGGEHISRYTLTKTIQHLLNNQIVVKLSKGSYQLNPLLIWRDKISERVETIDTIISDPTIKQTFLLEE